MPFPFGIKHVAFALRTASMCCAPGVESISPRSSNTHALSHPQLQAHTVVDLEFQHLTLKRDQIGQLNQHLTAVQIADLENHRLFLFFPRAPLSIGFRSGCESSDFAFLEGHSHVRATISTSNNLPLDHPQTIHHHHNLTELLRGRQLKWVLSESQSSSSTRQLATSSQSNSKVVLRTEALFTMVSVTFPLLQLRLQLLLLQMYIALRDLLTLNYASLSLSRCKQLRITSM